MNDVVRSIVTADNDEDAEDGGGAGAAAGLAKLLKHARDWNTNSRSSRVAQVRRASCTHLDLSRYADPIYRIVEDDDGFTRRVPNSFVVISERGQC